MNDFTSASELSPDKSPAKARPHNNLGNAYSLAGDLERAIAEFRVASQRDSTFKAAGENLAKA